MYVLLLVYSKLPRMVQITLMSFAVLKSYSIVPKQPLVVFMCCETLGFEFSNFSKSLRVLEKTMESPQWVFPTLSLKPTCYIGLVSKSTTLSDDALKISSGLLKVQGQTLFYYLLEPCKWLLHLSIRMRNSCLALSSAPKTRMSSFMSPPAAFSLCFPYQSLVSQARQSILRCQKRKHGIERMLTDTRNLGL
jgi:hypothetical protein